VTAGDGSVWALVVGAFVLGVVCTLVGLRLSRRVRVSSDASQAQVSDHPDLSPVLPEAPAEPGDAAQLPRALHTLVLTTVGEQVATGSAALVLSPPPHPTTMIWHLHFEPSIAMELPDGRSIPMPAPPTIHQWRLPSGQIVLVSQGMSDAPAGEATTTLRVAGPYLRVTLSSRDGRWRTVTARAYGDPRGPSDLTADVSDWRAVEAALRQACSLVLGASPRQAPAALGYGRAAWETHERVWMRSSTS
jgi:hypothetical protein